MPPVTIEDRKKELRLLLQQMQQRPSRDWSEERDRVALLNRMIAGGESGTRH